MTSASRRTDSSLRWERPNGACARFPKSQPGRLAHGPDENSGRAGRCEGFTVSSLSVSFPFGRGGQPGCARRMVSTARRDGHAWELKRYPAVMRLRGAAGWGLGVSLFVLGCAPFQTIPLDVEPRESSVYLDGEVLKDHSGTLKLRSDRDHTVLVKSEGHRGELVVLRSVVQEGDPVLVPPGVHVRLQPSRSNRREVQIEVLYPDEESTP